MLASDPARAAVQLAFVPVPTLGACRRCGRTLTNPIRIMVGIGPVCAGRCRIREAAMDDSDDRFDLPFDPVTMDVVCRRDGERPGFCHFNIPQRHVHHSPTGMEWGYEGSGPADYALNILATFLPPAQPVPEQPDDDATAADWEAYEAAVDAAGVELWDGSRVNATAWELHQPFKRDVVGRVPAAGGTIPGEAIRAWLRVGSSG
jgi:hypothetical protein